MLHFSLHILLFFMNWVFVLSQQEYTIKDAEFWKIIIGLGMASLFIFATMYSLQPILPVFTAEFQIPISYASLSVSLTTVGLIIGLVTIGFLSDRQGRLLFIHLSIISSALILFIIPFMESFAFIVFFRFLQGSTLSGVLGAALAYMAEEIDQKHFGFAATLYISCNSLGGMIGRFFTGYLAESFSWEVALFILGSFGAITFILVLFTLPKSKKFIQSSKPLLEDMKGFLVHFKNPLLLLMFGLGIVLQMAFTGMWTFLPFHLLEEPYNLSLQQISYFYLAYSLGIVGAPIAGWLTVKFSLSQIRVAGVIILSGGMFIVLGSSIIAISIGLSVICLGFFISHSITTTTVSQAATHHKGSASSLYLVAYYLGVSMGTTLLTPLWDTFGWNGIILFTAFLPIVYVGIVKITQANQFHHYKKQP